MCSSDHQEKERTGKHGRGIDRGWRRPGRGIGKPDRPPRGRDGHRWAAVVRTRRGAQRRRRTGRGRGSRRRSRRPWRDRRRGERGEDGAASEDGRGGLGFALPPINGAAPWGSRSGDSSERERGEGKTEAP